ncbi:uncharacterized protein [Epargyreus clarus]|uniref:uncharacterized protein n=1 Tax=Epargyreus clarus TaxID=520877 RepID=UPI003C2AD93C
MPITRSISSKRRGIKIEPAPPESNPVTEPQSAREVDAPIGIPSTPMTQTRGKKSIESLQSRSNESACSKKSIQRAEALERLAKAKLEEARAVTALAEAEVARIDAQSTVIDDHESGPDADKDKSFLIKSWLETQPKIGEPMDQDIYTTHQKNDTELHPAEFTDRRIPSQEPQMIDVAALAAALNEVARATSSQPLSKYVQDLPSFSGASNEWLAFRAAYRDTNGHFTKTENLIRLRRCLRGVAREAAISLFIAETEPDEVMRLLELRFGRPDALVIAEMEKIKTIPRLTDNPRDICVFASRINNIVAVVQALKKTYYLYNPEAIRAVVDKLTPAIKYRWYDYASTRPEDEPDLIKISDFLSREAELCSRYAPAENVRDRSPSIQKNPHRSYTTTLSEPIVRSISRKPVNAPDCPICQKDHKIRDCKTFNDLKVSDRWERAKEFNICFRCLNKRNFRHRCSYKACGVEDCKGSHHPLLHSTKPEEYTKESGSDLAVVTSTRPKTLETTFLKIVPVTIKGPKGSLETFALLDEGSTVTLIEESIAQDIGAIGPTEPFDIEGVAGARVSANTSRRVSLLITGKHAHKEHELTARTIDTLQLSPQAIDGDYLDKFKYLKEISDDLICNRGTPTLLIGQDNWHLIVSRSVKCGTRGQPVASFTELGWVLHGPSGDKTHRVHFVSKITVHNEEEEERIEDLMKNFFDLDAIGIEPKHPKNDPNERAISILEKRSRRLPNGQFETGLLWRNDDVVLPNNKNSAIRRLEGIERKLDKDANLKRQYNEQMAHLLDSGYAELATSSPRPGRIWYLPHFPVINPSKPKPRIVLDAAARSHGICLNDTLLSGPDLLMSLPGVLMRFRQRQVAVTADIKDMFLRITMREEDRDALRFLWREDRREGPPTEYRMRSVIFGAASSPCTAIYIKNRNAKEHQQQFPEAVDAIINNHYMDDYLQSFDSVEQAIRVASDVDYVHQRAKFFLQKWASNRPAVLAKLTSELNRRSEEVKLQDNPTTEKTLGLVWKPIEDHLTFNLNLKKVSIEICNGTKRPTKREALRTIMSLFDPLGLVTPVTVPAKRLLQDTWRLGVNWDEELPDDLHAAWLEWLRHMKQLSHLAIERCYPHFTDAAHVEMHIFVDASESACVAAVYWRSIYVDNTVHMSLVMAKGKVAPLKVTSVPRLELQAAVLGCRLARTVETEHDVKPGRRIFWTDSRTVLSWLRAGPRTYKPFVAHRVAEIEDDTKVSEWRWVPTALNVADDATRGTPSEFEHNHRWFRGPHFLYNSEESWPQEPESVVTPITGEERVATTTHGTQRLVDALPLVSKFSSWLRLVRTTGRVLQFIELCRPQRLAAPVGAIKRTRRSDVEDLWKKTTSRRPIQRPRTTASTPVKPCYVPLEAFYLKAAEKIWWKAAQEENFYNDICRLRKNLPIAKDSKLRALSVHLDEEGVMRLRSRIDLAINISPEQRNPPVLDGGSSYTRLYIAWIHKLNHHAGAETVVNEIRSRLWVLRLRPTVRSIIKSCIKCRLLRAKPSLPLTGDHPKTRLAHHERPFSFVGLDFFGPCGVTVGRRHEKRYVALFTCLTTRAVHIEVAGSLTSDSAIMALRRMMARRGCPTEIHSDNGTNLRGADAELRKAAYTATKDEATSRSITWRFIPPGAPFMGGAWERLVQSIKRALAATLNERYPTEEVLLTLLLEAEYTVNNRPLTPVSTSADDPESLTPLHFILGGPARVPQPGSFSDADLNARQRWRHTQRLADIFWARWVREYVPLLQNRREPRSQGPFPQIGDVVLLVDENLPRNTWPRGKITNLYPGKDGVIRVVEVKTKSGLLKRATKKVIVLTNEVHEMHGGRMCTTD